MKAHGAGNDFVLLPDLGGRLRLRASFVRLLCDRHRGLGADGVIRLAPPRGNVDADVFMDYWNADGSVVEMCGNGVRCVAKYVVDRGLADTTVRVDTRAGVKPVDVVGRDDAGRVRAVRVDMGAPQPTGTVEVDLSPTRLATAPYAPPLPPLGTDPTDVGMVTAEQRFVAFTTISMGNPHAVVVVDDVAEAPVRTWGPVVEHDEAFPNGTNVEFMSVPSRERVVGRIWERGVGETMASGTGSSAMAAAAHVLGLADRRVTVQLPGGELDVEWTAETLFVTGPAVEVASGTLDDRWLEQCRHD